MHTWSKVLANYRNICWSCSFNYHYLIKQKGILKSIIQPSKNKGKIVLYLVKHAIMFNSRFWFLPDLWFLWCLLGEVHKPDIHFPIGIILRRYRWVGTVLKFNFAKLLLILMIFSAEHRFYSWIRCQMVWQIFNFPKTTKSVYLQPIEWHFGLKHF